MPQAVVERNIAGLNHPGLVGITNTWVCQHPMMVRILEPNYPAGFQPPLLVQEMTLKPGGSLEAYFLSQVRAPEHSSAVTTCQLVLCMGCSVTATQGASPHEHDQLQHAKLQLHNRPDHLKPGVVAGFAGA